MGRASYVAEWKELENEFQQITNLIVPRSAAPENNCYTLHIFCDASTKAYGAAAYLVSDSESLLLTSKVRVAPLKTKTIPQLELTALGRDWVHTLTMFLTIWKSLKHTCGQTAKFACNG